MDDVQRRWPRIEERRLLLRRFAQAREDHARRVEIEAERRRGDEGLALVSLRRRPDRDALRDGPARP